MKDIKNKEEKIPQISIISAMVCTESLSNAVHEVRNEFGIKFDLNIVFVNDINCGIVSREKFIDLIYESDIFLIDIRGNNPATEILIQTLEVMERRNKLLFDEKTIISLVGGNKELREITKMGSFEAKKIPSKKSDPLSFDVIPDITEFVKKGIKMSKTFAKIGKLIPIGSMKHMKNWTLAMDYWTYGFSGVPENHKNLMLFLLKEYLGFKSLNYQNPLKIPPFGIYDPTINQYFSDLDSYLEVKPLDSKKQTIGIFYYGGCYFEQTLPVLLEFMDKLSDYNIIPLYSEVLDNLKSQISFFFKDNIPIVNSVINLQYFQINGGPFGGNNSDTLNMYSQMNVPQFNPIISFDMTYEEYLESKQGMNPINQVIAVIMPELDGRIEMMTVGCMNNLGYSDEINAPVLNVAPISETIDLQCKRIKKWMDLRIKSNSEKKIVLVVYDYPPGEANIGNASYLDVSVSVKNILDELKKEGYNVQDVPDNFDLSTILIESKSINQPKFIAQDEFKGVFLGLSEYLKFFDELPLGLQTEIEENWGKPLGKLMIRNNKLLLPILKFGNIYIGLQPARTNTNKDVNEYHNKEIPPHHQYIAFYRYIEQIIDADAIIHVGTHGTLEFLPGKENVGHVNDYNINLQGSIPNLYLYHVSNTSESAIAKRRSNAVIINHSTPAIKTSELYEEYERLDSLIAEYQNLIRENASDKDTSESLKNEINELAKILELSFDSIDELEGLLYRLKLSAIPSGLHVFGKIFDLDDKIDLISDIILHSDSIDMAISHIFSQLGNDDIQRMEKIKKIIFSIISNSDKNNQNQIAENIGILNNISDENFKIFEDWVRDINHRLDGNLEMINLIKALEGGFIIPGFGGDPIRSPNIFPTGRNSFGFDPRLIPSTSAFKRGKEIAEELIKRHKINHDKWPETVSVVLWAFETMKTGGETIGQIFNYLGVRAVKNKSVWTTELEVIPLDELKRPRINVVVTICGIFRDTFPYIMDLINTAVELVSNLDEPIEWNFIKKTMLELEQDNAEFPSARIFGPALGKYNTNLTDIIGSGRWDSENELADDYINNMGHVYLINQQIERKPETFKKNISNIELMSQIRDSTEYNITDLDHYYEFTGGLAKAHEEITGKKAEILIADTSTKKINIDKIENSIKEGIITRNLNPKWIDGMLNHKSHGGQKIAERVENMLGFAATTHSVENWIWEKMNDKYILDENIKNRLVENNRFAVMEIIKTLLEAEKRGYWETKEENIDNLKKEFLELEHWIEINYEK